MKLLFPTVLALGASVAFGACQNSHRSESRDDFNTRTHRTYNHETGGFEQQPPYGKQSNKSDTNPGS